LERWERKADFQGAGPLAALPAVLDMLARGMRWVRRWVSLEAMVADWRWDNQFNSISCFVKEGRDWTKTLKIVRDIVGDLNYILIRSL